MANHLIRSYLELKNLINEEKKVLSERIALLKKNADFLANLNEDDIDSKMQIVSAALPGEKDFTGILNAIMAFVVPATVVVCLKQIYLMSEAK